MEVAETRNRELRKELEQFPDALPCFVDASRRSEGSGQSGECRHSDRTAPLLVTLECVDGFIVFERNRGTPYSFPARRWISPALAARRQAGDDAPEGAHLLLGELGARVSPLRHGLSCRRDGCQGRTQMALARRIRGTLGLAPGEAARGQAGEREPSRPVPHQGQRRPRERAHLPHSGRGILRPHQDYRGQGRAMVLHRGGRTSCRMETVETMTSSLDIYRAANELIRQHGRDAPIHAA